MSGNPFCPGYPSRVHKGKGGPEGGSVGGPIDRPDSILLLLLCLSLLCGWVLGSSLLMVWFLIKTWPFSSQGLYTIVYAHPEFTHLPFPFRFFWKGKWSGFRRAHGLDDELMIDDARHDGWMVIANSKVCKHGAQFACWVHFRSLSLLLSCDFYLGMLYPTQVLLILVIQ